MMSTAGTTSLGKIATAAGGRGAIHRRLLLASLPSRTAQNPLRPTVSSFWSSSSSSIINKQQHRFRVFSSRISGDNAISSANNTIRRGVSISARNSLHESFVGQPTIQTTTKQGRQNHQRCFSSFVDKLKRKAEDTAKTLAQRASRKIEETADTATQSAMKAASKTQKAAREVASNALSGTQQAAEKAAQRAATKTQAAASKVANRVTKATGDAIRSKTRPIRTELSKQAASVKQTTTETLVTSQKAVQDTASKAKESSMQLKESLSSTGSKVLRGLWWWSLAAIFVYGVASTLPMAVIKYTVEQKKEKFKERTSGGSETTTTTTTTESDNGNANSAESSTQDTTKFGFDARP